jgi:predicted RNA-binding Zn ribbon-like protein
LESLPQERTRVCAGPRCGWLFIDRSKAGRRRWCDMATCGNAAKGRRNYQRRRAAAASSER